MEDISLLKQPDFEGSLVDANEKIKEAQYAKKLIEQQLSAGTRRVYKSDWRIFEEWCNSRQYISTNASPEIIAMFISSQFDLGKHPSTLNRRLSAIKFAYSCLDKDSPTEKHIVRAILRGIRRDEKAKPVQPKKALLVNILRKLVKVYSSNSLRDIRARAILLLGFAGAFRRSELVAINIEDISYNEKGMEIKIHRSKTDQEKQGDITIILPGKETLSCPIANVQLWIEKAEIKNGGLFRGIGKGNKVLKNRLSVNVIYNLIKECAAKLELPLQDYSPHSLRAGFVTSAYENGAWLSKILEQARMKSIQTGYRYVRHAQRYENHAGEDLL